MEDRSYKKNRPVIILVAIAGMSVYLLPYFRYYYYDAYVAYFGFNDLQMGMLGSVFGALSIVGYCLGGWVADRVPLKLAISGSLIVTGIGAIILLMKPAFLIYVAIYALWGVTSILTFWNPCMKALRALCKPEEQGRGYALFDMVRGVLNFLMGLAVLAAYTAVAKKIGDTKGLTGLIIFYGLEAIIVGIIVCFALKKALPEFLESKVENKNSSFAKNVIETLKKPTTWCAIVIMFMTYGVIITYGVAESIMPMYNGRCLEHFSGLSGYEAIFKTFIAMLCVAVVACLIFRRLTKERRKELSQMRAKETNK